MPRSARPLAARLALAGGLALAALPAAAHIAAIGQTVEEARPDLIQGLPSQLGVRSDVVRGRRHFRIGFASTVVNGGRGGLLLDARRPSRRTRHMTADQLVVRTNGTLRRYRRVGHMVYVSNADHEHWHFVRFERYALRRSPSGRIVGRDHKTGFCPTEDYRDRRYPAAPARIFDAGYVEDTNCGNGSPGIRRVKTTIYAGYADQYVPFIEGQSIDVTGLPAGSYELVHRVNDRRLLRELRYDNDAASVRFRLTWPRGHRRLPRLRVVARCPGRPRCPAR